MARPLRCTAPTGFRVRVGARRSALDATRLARVERSAFAGKQSGQMSVHAVTGDGAPRH
jgi:hypothetical protein